MRERMQRLNDRCRRAASDGIPPRQEVSRQQSLVSSGEVRMMDGETVYGKVGDVVGYLGVASAAVMALRRRRGGGPGGTDAAAAAMRPAA